MLVVLIIVSNFGLTSQRSNLRKIVCWRDDWPRRKINERQRARDSRSTTSLSTYEAACGRQATAVATCVACCDYLLGIMYPSIEILAAISSQQSCYSHILLSGSSDFAQSTRYTFSGILPAKVSVGPKIPSTLLSQYASVILRLPDTRWLESLTRELMHVGC